MTLNLKTTVRGGRLVLDEPIDLPDGSEVELALVENGDELDDEDRARLHAALCLARCYADAVNLRAKVRGGRLQLDEPVDLPEGCEVDLIPVDDGDELDDEDRARLHAALEQAERDLEAGHVIDADEVMRRLRARHAP